jgi:hypothetical protein
MNSLVILALNTQVVSGHHPRVSFQISLKMGRVSLDAVCRAHRVGSPVVMSSLAMVTDALA